MCCGSNRRGRAVSAAAATVVTGASDVSVTAVEAAGSSLEQAPRTITQEQRQ